MLDDGAGPASLRSDAKWSAGRRRALTPRARAPRDPHPLKGTLGSRKLGAKAGPRQWSAQGRPTQALWRLPALHPLVRGEKETGIRAHPAARKTRRREAERWLNELREFEIEPRDACATFSDCPSRAGRFPPSGPRSSSCGRTGGTATCRPSTRRCPAQSSTCCCGPPRCPCPCRALA